MLTKPMPGFREPNFLVVSNLTQWENILSMNPNYQEMLKLDPKSKLFYLDRHFTGLPYQLKKGSGITVKQSIKNGIRLHRDKFNLKEIRVNFTRSVRLNEIYYTQSADRHWVKI